MGHVFVEGSIDPVSSFLLITCCLTDANDWNQIKPVCDSALGWTVWPSGRCDSETQVMNPSSASMVSSEHTPINLPTRDMGFQQEYDATIAASEVLNLPCYSGASSSSQHTAASTVPTGIKQTCADMDGETDVSSLFGTVSKEKKDRDQNVVQTLKDKQHLHKSLERKAEWPCDYSYNRRISGLIRLKEIK